MTFLTPCSGCRRHVQAEASTCPFCGVQAPGANAPPVRVVRQRLSRQAMAAIGASAIVVGCGGTESGTPIYGAPADTMSDAVSMDAAYGAPADTGIDSAVSFDAAYGAPVDTGFDAGDTGSSDTGTPDATKDTGGDVGVKDTGGPSPAYGLPPADSGA